MLRLEQHHDKDVAEFDFEPFLDRDGVWLVERWVAPVDVWVGDSRYKKLEKKTVTKLIRCHVKKGRIEKKSPAQQEGNV